MIQLNIILSVLFPLILLIVIIITREHQTNNIQNQQKYNHNNVHFITYANDKFNKSKNRILKQAKQSNFFKTIKAYSPSDITVDFQSKFSKILKHQRGGGYWIWKFDIIIQTLQNIPQNDILVYLDAGCTINQNGKHMFET
jgi:hypothetical protein